MLALATDFIIKTTKEACKQYIIQVPGYKIAIVDITYRDRTFNNGKYLLLLTEVSFGCMHAYIIGVGISSSAMKVSVVC